ncbi:unnamed protein product [Amoebophrya sp. A120]|nr:unnamed protein product [Amoebophrya sp. A120]|eukprot:GSA120T00026017001.1
MLRSALQMFSAMQNLDEKHCFCALPDDPDIFAVDEPSSSFTSASSAGDSFLSAASDLGGGEPFPHVDLPAAPPRSILRTTRTSTSIRHADTIMQPITESERASASGISFTDRAINRSRNNITNDPHMLEARNNAEQQNGGRFFTADERRERQRRRRDGNRSATPVRGLVPQPRPRNSSPAGVATAVPSPPVEAHHLPQQQTMGGASSSSSGAASAPQQQTMGGASSSSSGGNVPPAAQTNGRRRRARLDPNVEVVAIPDEMSTRRRCILFQKAAATAGVVAGGAGCVAGMASGCTPAHAVVSIGSACFGVACCDWREKKSQQLQRRVPVAHHRAEGSGLPRLPPGIAVGHETTVQMLVGGHGAAAQGSAPSGATSAAAPGGAQHDPLSNRAAIMIEILF